MPIPKEDVTCALSKHPVRHCGEIIEIKQSGVEFYSDSLQSIDNSRMVKYALRDITAYEIVSQDALFINECLSFINGLSLPCFRLYLPSWYLLPSFAFSGYTVEKQSSFADFVLPEGYSIEPSFENGEIIVLNDTD